MQSAYKNIGIFPDEQGMLNSSVSFDGSWQRRRYLKKDPSDEWRQQNSRKSLKNFDGSANTMEAECAIRRWKRSIDKIGMRYTTMLYDADSRSFDVVFREEIYGEDTAIEKVDCINHVFKRIGTALRNLISEAKS